MHHEDDDGEPHLHPPSRCHVVIARRLTRLLEDAVPATCEVLPGFGWRMRVGSDFEPEIMVSERGAPGPDLLRVAPLLVVDVTSPSTKGDDWGRKTALHAEGGLLGYWIVEPDVDTLTALHDGGSFQVVRRIDGGSVTLSAPFAVELDTAGIFTS